DDLAAERVADHPVHVHLAHPVVDLVLRGAGQAFGELAHAGVPVAVAAFEEDGGPGLDHVRKRLFTPAHSVPVTEVTVFGQGAGDGLGKQRIVTHRTLLGVTDIVSRIPL